ncbi:UNVERIFIED_CONTAM: hypothetical protein GTU68_035702, partial [Idotea baltica]|nr:hypothetical protein [Idotea baltica]
NSASKLKEHLPETYWDSIIEICPYLTESLGNSTRIDYGTGHELAFVMFLCSLHKIGALTKEDSTATVTVLFAKYLNLCRKLQTTYKMEPAGSQGVWSLDDFQFVPFIWGSSQLAMNPKISPEMFTHTNVVKENRDEYLFLACIEYIMSVKTGPFAEHSNQLWNISAVQSWSKINQGLFKMYKAEILNKFPIIQHVLFGAIFSLSPAQSPRFGPPLGMGALKSCAAMRGPRPPTGPLPRMPMGPGVMPTGMMPRSEVPSAACMMPPAGTVRSEPPVQGDSESTKGSPLKLA